MFPHQLIGKKVKRTKNIEFDLYKDASFTEEPVVLVSYKKDEIVVKFVNDDRKITLNSKWNDDNWEPIET